MKLMPFFLYNVLKRIRHNVLWTIYKSCYVKKGDKTSWGKGFRFERRKPYYCVIGDGTNIDAYNIWNCNQGNIIIGEHCWLGLHNILMGPLRLGDGVETGPHVRFLGIRHAVSGYAQRDAGVETIIGNNVWISTGAIIQFGITIGENSVIAPGTVVTKDVKPDSFIAGNPGRDLTHITSVNVEERKKLHHE